MSRKKINDTKLLRLVDEGRSFAEVGKFFGVSPQAAHKRFKELRGKTTKVVVAKKIEQIVDRKIDAIDQLYKVNGYANELLDLLMRWNRGDEEALQILESQVRKVRIRGSEEEVTEYKFKDPRELALKAMTEIRGQLGLQIEIFKTLYDLKAVADFQNEVLAAIREAAPDVRDRIVNNLRKAKAIRSTVDYGWS
jgi:DNA-binding Lrp family transcriptional regulator